MKATRHFFSIKNIPLLMLAIVFVIAVPKASAAPVTGFDPARIIDDFVMTNSKSMTVAQIQTFLNSKVPVCDNYGTNGTTATSRSDYFDSKGWSIPLKCLKEYTENNKSSAQIIYDAGIEYSINPQVLIVLLQKEQGLVTDDWPDPNQYRSATGYGCPDTAACDSDYYGFTNQVRWAARMFRAILNDSPTWHTPYVLGNNYIKYNPTTSCGGSTVNIQNRSTQALYNYTPYQPNSAALNAGYGSGDSCSAYGNRNFYQYFKDWFGSTYGILDELTERYTQISGQIGKVLEMGYCDTEKTLCWQHFVNGYIIYGSETGAWESKGAIRERWSKLSYQKGSAGLPTGPEVYDKTAKTWSQTYQKGIIIGTDRTGYWFIPSDINARWQEMGSSTSTLGMPKSNTGKSGDVSWQEFEKGFIVGSVETGFWESKGAIRERWSKLSYQKGSAGLPTGAEARDETNKTWSQTYQNGIIIGTDRTGYWFVPTAINTRWQELGSATSGIGMPKSNTGQSGDTIWQEFERGFIVGSSQTGFWESKGAIRAYWATIGYQSGAAGLPIGAEVWDEATATWTQEYQHMTISYSGAAGIQTVQK